MLLLLVRKSLLRVKGAFRQIYCSLGLLLALIPKVREQFSYDFVFSLQKTSQQKELPSVNPPG